MMIVGGVMFTVGFGVLVLFLVWAVGVILVEFIRDASREDAPVVVIVACVALAISGLLIMAANSHEKAPAPPASEGGE